MAEAAFRTVKSELYIRPLFHQLEPRVKAHVLEAFLGYALLGHAQPPAEAPTSGRSKTVGQRSSQCSSFYPR